ncbi:MAG: carbohydrate kinase family protein [Patescibacteria group bacterium]
MRNPKNKPELDFIAIGESLRDVFYLINEATLSCSINKDKCLLCLEYAEKIPVRQVVKVPAAGNSGNAAVTASRLGLKTALMTWVGKDHSGDHIRESLQKEKIDNRYVIIDPDFPTSEATIINYSGEKTQLVFFQPRKYKLPHFASTRCVYYSAMSETHAGFDKLLLNEMKNRKETFFSFQPGTTHIHRGLKPLMPLIALSDLFTLNKDEAYHLLGDGERTICNMLETFRHLGAKIAIITDGANGADAFDGKNHWHMPIFKGKSKERTGAGDAFASAVTVALLNNKDLPTALRYGTANSWSVIQEVGPQKGLLNSKEMQDVLKKFSSIKPILHAH